MKIYIIAILFALVSLAASQTEMPSCATTCAAMAVGSLTGCRNEDFQCVCQAEDFITDIAKCITKSCKPEDIEIAVDYSRLLCANAGVVLPTDIVESALAAATSKATKTQTAEVTKTTTAGSVETETEPVDGAAGSIGEGCVVMAAAAMAVALVIGV